MCVGITQNVSGILDNGKLHTEANSEKRNIVRSCILNRRDFAVDSSVAETARNQNSVCVFKLFRRVFARYFFGINPVYFNIYVVCDSAVFERLGNADIRVVQGNVFADKRDAHTAF